LGYVIARRYTSGVLGGNQGRPSSGDHYLEDVSARQDRSVGHVDVVGHRIYDWTLECLNEETSVHLPCLYGTLASRRVKRVTRAKRDSYNLESEDCRWTTAMRQVRVDIIRSLDQSRRL
jgi:hypothetical protein